MTSRCPLPPCVQCATHAPARRIGIWWTILVDKAVGLAASEPAWCCLNLNPGVLRPSQVQSPRRSCTAQGAAGQNPLVPEMPLPSSSLCLPGHSWGGRKSIRGWACLSVPELPFVSHRPRPLLCAPSAPHSPPSSCFSHLAEIIHGLLCRDSILSLY